MCNLTICVIYVNIYLKGILYPFLRGRQYIMYNVWRNSKVKNEREIIKLEKEVNVLCSKVLRNFRKFRKGEIKITYDKSNEDWGLAKL